MYLLLSPAKNLNETDAIPLALADAYSQPVLMAHACDLMAVLKPLAPTDLSALMGISDKLAQTNAVRNQQWAWDTDKPFSTEGDTPAKPAIYLFDGDVYTGLNAYQLGHAEIHYLNNQVGILSGLYGVLKPLDLVLPYRLEMGTKLANPRGKDLYQFWGHHLTELLNARMAEIGSETLVNLASNEYFKAVNPKHLAADIITPRFEDSKDGKYKVISFYAKKARGLMARYAAENQLTDVNDLKSFDLDGYRFVEAASTGSDWVFRR